jgi:hypothetical protein
LGLPLVLLAVVLLGSGVVALPIALSLLRRLRELETKQKLQESRLRRLEGPAPSDATFARPASTPAPAMTR